MIPASSSQQRRLARSRCGRRARPPRRARPRTRRRAAPRRRSPRDAAARDDELLQRARAAAGRRGSAATTRSTRISPGRHAARRYRKRPPDEPGEHARRTPGRRSASRSARSRARARAPSPRLGVEVPADLEVVGDEADRADEHVARRRARAGRRGGRGCPARATARRSATRSGTRTTSRRARRARRRARDVSSSWSSYGSPSSRIRAGQRVRGEDDVRVGAADAVGEQVDEARARRASSRRRRARRGRRAPPRAARGSRRSTAPSSAGRARGRRSVRRRRRARASTASAIRGVQCFMPVKTGTPSSRSSAARVSSVIAFSGELVLDPERAVALDEVLEQLGPDRPPAADVGVVGGHVLEPLGRPVRHQDDGATLITRGTPTRAPRGRARRAGRARPGRCRGSTPWPRLKMWPGRPPARVEDVARRRLDPLPRPEQHGRVEVALHAAVVADLRPAAVERDPPVEADHVAAGLGHRAQQRRRAGAEVDRRHVDRGEDPRRVRRDELLVVRRRERADPRVEELDHVGARRATLRGHVARERVRELLHQRVPDVRLAVHQRLHRREVAARLPLDEVAGDGERPAAEADDRLVVARARARTSRTASSIDGTDSSGSGTRRRSTSASVAHRLGDDRADALDELDVDAHRRGPGS